MEYILYFCRFLYRIRWWLILGTLAVTFGVYLATANLGKTYKVEATLYTGIVSGYSIEGGSVTDWAATNNAIDNLINIIKAESTLKRVSYRLYARNMINGNLDKDTPYLTSHSFREIYNRTKNSKDGQALLALIDKNSEEETVNNMLKYERPDADNFIYGLFYWYHWHYSYEALKNISVRRKGSSDLLEVTYLSGDPGIAYNTIEILMEEFIEEYRQIRYGEIDKVIEYFRQELARVGRELKLAEDSLTLYNIEKRVINYYDETKEIASINKEFELREQDILFAYNSSKAALEELEKQLYANIAHLKNNAQFISSLNKVSELTSKIAELESFLDNTSELENQKIEGYKKQLESESEKMLKYQTQYVDNMHTKEGLAKTTIVEQWLEQILLFEKAKAELDIIQRSRQELNEKYAFFAPVGSTIKRKERQIDVTERSYLSIQKSYHDALMRRKNLEMTSATIKVLNHPAYPIHPEPSKRKQIVFMAALASFLFLLGIFFLIEMLDRTLRDRLRAERITNGSFIGAFPATASFKYKNYNDSYIAMATQYLSNIALGFLKDKKENEPFIINFLSTESNDGKTYLSEKLENHWKNMGIEVTRISWDKDFDTNNKRYLLAESIEDIYSIKDEDILIIEHPNIKEHSVPNKLIKKATLNLIVVRADRAWKDSDRFLFEKLKEQTNNSSIYFYLNKTSLEATQTFIGMLPPYTYLRKLGYKISQLGLTERLSKDSEEIIDNE